MQWAVIGGCLAALLTLAATEVSTNTGTATIDTCYTGVGASYSGKVSTTRSNKTCQRWDTTSPHEHLYSTSADKYPDDSVAEAANYCRNPSRYYRGLWCYTTDPNTKWELCDIPQCQDGEEDIYKCRFYNKQRAIYFSARYKPELGKELNQVDKGYPDPVTSLYTTFKGILLDSLRANGAGGIYQATTLKMRMSNGAKGPGGYFGVQWRGHPKQRDSVLISLWNRGKYTIPMHENCHLNCHDCGKNRPAEPGEVRGTSCNVRFPLLPHPNKKVKKHKMQQGDIVKLTLQREAVESTTFKREKKKKKKNKKNKKKNLTKEEEIEAAVKEAAKEAKEAAEEAEEAALYKDYNESRNYTGHVWRLTALFAGNVEVTVGRILIHDPDLEGQVGADNSAAGIIKLAMFHEHLACNGCGKFAFEVERTGPFITKTTKHSNCTPGSLGNVCPEIVNMGITSKCKAKDGCSCKQFNATSDALGEITLKTGSVDYHPNPVWDENIEHGNGKYSFYPKEEL